jgi:hypothetical protein
MIHLNNNGNMAFALKTVSEQMTDKNRKKSQIKVHPADGQVKSPFAPVKWISNCSTPYSFKNFITKIPFSLDKINYNDNQAAHTNQLDLFQPAEGVSACGAFR